MREGRPGRQAQARQPPVVCLDSTNTTYICLPPVSTRFLCTQQQSACLFPLCVLTLVLSPLPQALGFLAKVHPDGTRVLTPFEFVSYMDGRLPKDQCPLSPTQCSLSLALVLTSLSLFQCILLS